MMMKDGFVKNFDEGDWETAQCYSCKHFRESDDFMGCTSPNYDDFIEYDRGTALCRGYKRIVKLQDTLDEIARRHNGLEY